MKKKYDIDTHLKAIASEEIKIPANLSSITVERVLSGVKSDKTLFPIVLVMVFAVNILISLLFGGVLYLMRPISIIEWLIIGSKLFDVRPCYR